MIYITGDTHRDFARVEEFCEEYGTTEDDILIILGDVGINYYLDDRDDEIKEELSQLPITLLCIHGNHEERPNLLIVIPKDVEEDLSSLKKITQTFFLQKMERFTILTEEKR